MIGLVIVFGVIAVTLISLNAQQTSVLSTGQRATELQHDRIVEKLSIELEDCSPETDGIVSLLSTSITNKGSETSRITTLLLSRDSPINVTDAYDMWTDFSQYDYEDIEISSSKVNDNFVRPFIISGDVVTFDVQNIQVRTNVNVPTSHAPTKMIFVTDLGNKYVLPINIALDCV